MFENVAYPLREHTRLPEDMVRKLVLMKLEAVGLRGARDLMPSELSGGMARRVALARAIALDPMMIMYDEPFTGQDPISMGVLVQLIRRLNDAAHLTSIVVSHDVAETCGIADLAYVIAKGKIIESGPPNSSARLALTLGQAVHARPAGRPGALPLRRAVAGAGPARRRRMIDALADLGRRGIAATQRLGRGHLLLLAMLRGSGEVLRRPRLLRPAGLLGGRAVGADRRRVGPVRRHGAGTAGLLHPVPVRRRGDAGRDGGRLAGARAGPRGHGAAVRRPRRLRADRRDRPDEGHRAAVGTGDDGGGAGPPRADAALFRRIISMPLLAAMFSALGVMGGWFVGVGLLGVDDGTYWAQMQAKIDFDEDVINGVIKSLVFGWVCTWIALFQGYDCVPTSEGVSRATTRTVVHSALAVLGLDFVLTALMFGD